jgi:hypothetical protein
LINSKEYKTKVKKVPISLTGESSLSYSYHTSIEEIIQIIHDLHAEDVFFESAFHRSLEEFPPGEMYFRFVVIWEKNIASALLYFQLKKINLRESLDGSFGKEFSVGTWIKKKLAGILNFYTLVNGNMLQTGRYGQYLPKEIGSKLSFKDYHLIVDFVVEQLKKEKLKPVAILLKDYYDEERITNDNCHEYGYVEFSVQPNMRVDIRSNWNSIEDYMSDLKSKYRVRTRRTRKKLNGVERKLLDLDELEFYEDKMHELYKTIADQASFNLFILNKKYFYGLKKHLKDRIKIIGYFLNNKMVGFYTIIYNYNTLDAHFLGYDSDHNREFHLYHNMLYDLLFEAIEKNKEHLDLSRTAMEIKSSIGANAYPMFLYLRILNNFLNKFTGRFLKFLAPTVEWEERGPFK